jgi:hypothetical protein
MERFQPPWDVLSIEQLAKPQLNAIVLNCARQVLNNAWKEADGYCRPHDGQYPHLWLWDSCFHSLGWLGLNDQRALRELEAVFVGQLANGFVPHMRYGGPTSSRGPLSTVSSFTQPPVYAHALLMLQQRGQSPSRALVEKATAGLEALWAERLKKGLLVIYHPWESGADDSPRWDSWLGSGWWQRFRYRYLISRLIHRHFLNATTFGEHGQAIGNSEFVVAPAGFNAIAAHAAMELGRLLDDRRWTRRGEDLAEALEPQWLDSEGLWSDRADVGGGDSVHVPTLDGVLGALCSPNRQRCFIALNQLRDPDRFGAPFGPTYVARRHPLYNPDAYWRGVTWPQLNYLAARGASRVGLHHIAEDVQASTKRGCLTSRFSEYWNPETGQARGATPQTWAAVASLFCT